MKSKVLVMFLLTLLFGDLASSQDDNVDQLDSPLGLHQDGNVKP